MTKAIELLPFFERAEDSIDGLPTESYVAGFRRPDDITRTVEITLPAQMVELTVLTGARLSLWLNLDGRLVLDGDGLDDETLEAASSAGPIGKQTCSHWSPPRSTQSISQQRTIRWVIWQR
jgi:hypothetical protein